MTEVKNFLSKRWEIILTIALIIFNVGYTVARLEDTPSLDQVKTEIKTAVNDHENKTKDVYVRKDQVPGLIEELNAINDKLKDLGKRFEKIEDKILFSKTLSGVGK